MKAKRDRLVLVKEDAGGGANKPQPKTATCDLPLVVLENKNKKPVRNYKRHVKKLISDEFAGIMQTMAEKSVEGSLPHTKYLFEIGGVKEDIERQSRGKAEPSLAELLVAAIKKKKLEELPAMPDENGSWGTTAASAEGDDADERGGDCQAREL